MSLLCLKEEPQEGKNKDKRKKLKKKKSKTELDSSISEKSETSENEAGVLADDELTDYEEAQIKLCEWKTEDFVRSKEEKEFNEILNKTLPLLSTNSTNFMPNAIHTGGPIGRRNEGGFNRRYMKFNNGLSSRAYKRAKRRNYKNLPQYKPKEEVSSSSESRSVVNKETTNCEPRNKRRKCVKEQKRIQKFEDKDLVLPHNDEPIPPSNIGYKMLASMGWSPGGALSTHGILEPVIPRGRRKRKGGLEPVIPRGRRKRKG